MTKEEHFQEELKRLKAEEEDAVRRMGKLPSKFDIPENAPAVLFTEALLRSAALLEASDIHLSPEEDLVRVSFRIDGEREEHIVFPKAGYPAVCARLKILSSMNVAECRLPQDGRMNFCFYDNDYDVRVSSFPTIFGERFVLRILPRICPYTWEELVSCPEEEAAIQRMLSRPGLVLLTGPTGSGKSTLLHIAGGLDSPTEGEIVVLGKSSKDFTESDYDGYRNAYVGFIFQEYNVLDEFTVEENIALALQLQGKPQTKEKIAVILREVDLLSLADRKPNTLSGGQKQRVAIARALVKDPKIVLADEPTGALDSQTGKQVFEILKKLARERLVIVVSHDREFAEAYADRIIELKDGRICADRTREKAPVDREDTVTEADEDTLLIRSGKEISPETLQRIEHFIREGDELVLLRGKRNILDFKRSRRISPNGTQERFLPTPPAEDMPTESEAAARFLPSRLPFRKAFRLGASGLKGRPFRLALTILLSVVAFVAFGLFSTVMLYDENAVLRASFLSSDTEYLTLEKTYRSTVSYKIWGTPNSYETSASALFTPSELSSFGGERALGAFAWNVIPENTVLSEKAVYWSCHIQNAVYVPEGHTLRSRILAGRYPEAENEICVSSYFYESCKAGEVFPLEENGSLSDKGVTLGEPDDLLGQELLLNGQRYVVSGVFDSGTIPEKFEALLASDAYDSLYYALRTFTREGLQGAALISETAAADFREALRSSAPSGNDPFDTSGLRYYLSPFPSEEEQELWAVDRFQIADEQIPYKTYCLLDTSTLADDQFIAPLSFVARLSAGDLRFSLNVIEQCLLQ